MRAALALVVLTLIIEITYGGYISNPKCRQNCPANYDPVTAKDSKGMKKTFSNQCAMRVWNECEGTDFKETCPYSCDDSDNDPVTAKDSQGNVYNFQSCCHLYVNNLCYETDYSCDKCTKMFNDGQIRVFSDEKK